MDCCRVVCCNFYIVRVLYMPSKVSLFVFSTKTPPKNLSLLFSTRVLFKRPHTSKKQNAQTSDKEDDCCARWNLRVDDDDDDDDDDASIRRAELLL